MKIKLNCKEERYIETVDYFTLKSVNKIRKGKKKDPVYYLKQPAFLDTETSWNHDTENPLAWVYQWCMEFNGQYCIGRYVFDLIREFRKIYDYYELGDKKRLVIYVHNLSYDHQYIYKQLYKEFGAPEILAIKSHKILIARYGGLEFRCTWLLSNMSLDQWGAKLQAPVRKMVSAIDYDVIRYPDDKLTYTDWLYMVNDVAALKCNTYLEMINESDTVANVPFTSTGYVRRDCRTASRHEDGYRKYFISTKLDVNIYKPLFFCYAGGLVHGNRYLAGKTQYKTKHGDFKSFFPAINVSRYLPMGPFRFIYSFMSEFKSFPTERLKRYLKEKCCVMLVRFNNLYIDPKVTCPCLSKNKIFNYPQVRFTINDRGTFGTDNGRVINAIGDCLIYCTELDFYWIKEQYRTDGFQLVELYAADRGYERQCIVDTTNEYFKGKEQLPKDSTFYMKQKAKLNAVYGMQATNPIRSEVEIDVDTGVWTEVRNMKESHIQEALDKFYKSYNSFTNYAHGVYITSWSRSLLLTIIRDCIGYENFIYCDTDSAFYLDKPGIQERIDKFNSDVIELNKRRGLGVENRKGKMSYYGVFEMEEDCKEFRFLHAKCYAYKDYDDKLHCTIAGVTSDNKKLKTDPDYKTREDELGSLDNLADGMTFKECGGTTSLYIDRDIEYIDIGKHVVEVAGACIIRQTEKQIGGTVDGFNIYEVV